MRRGDGGASARPGWEGCEIERARWGGRDCRCGGAGGIGNISDLARGWRGGISDLALGWGWRVCGFGRSRGVYVIWILTARGVGVLCKLSAWFRWEGPQTERGDGGWEGFRISARVGCECFAMNMRGGGGRDSRLSARVRREGVQNQRRPGVGEMSILTRLWDERELRT